ncbi:MAG: LamG-like jellyroll fold domain-containing protein [Saprospiraceae bacterium]
MKMLFLLLSVYLLSFDIVTGQCENRCLAFDPNNVSPNVADKIIINDPILSFTNFTFEVWVKAEAAYPASGFYSTLVEFKDFVAPGNNISIKMDNSRKIIVFYGAITQITSTIMLTTNWHHLALSNGGGQLILYVDGVSQGSVTSSLFLDFASSNHVVVGGNISTNTDGWKGKMDEIRMWSSVRTQTQISQNYHCICNANEPDLVIWIPLDQGNPGNNNLGSFANDLSPIVGNTNGAITSFSLTGSNSNFVCSNNLLLEYPNYQNAQIKFFDYSDATTQVSQICSGDPLIFKLIMADGTLADFPNVLVNGSPLNSSNTTFTWQEYDDASSMWNSVSSFSTSGFAFPVAPNILAANCNANNLGYSTKKYRVKIDLFDPITNSNCSYLTQESTLKICCPVTNFNLGLITNDADNLFCASQLANFQLNIQSTDLFVNALAAGVTIDWEVNGVLQSSHLLNLNYNGNLTSPKTCIKAIITNCACKTVIKEICIDVDPVPVCSGTIKVIPSSSVTMTGPNTYTICPGTSAQLTLDPVGGFYDGILHWEYSFNNSTWSPLGTSNIVQNTNILPQTSPPNPSVSPYLWPLGQQCIYYRLVNLPIHNPSACSSCISNVISICLKAPLPNITITGANMKCEGASTQLTVTPITPGTTYTWFYNGNLLNTGSSISVTGDGNYWVQSSSLQGCEIKESPIHNVTICKIKPIIICPPCVRTGNPVTLNACTSEDRCNKPLTYKWLANNGSPTTGISCNFIHTMPATGTTYTLAVTNSIGCSATKVINLKPCP